MWNNWADFWYDTADFFFGKQMDKAYSQGIRAGSEYAARNISKQDSQCRHKGADKDSARRSRRSRSGNDCG